MANPLRAKMKKKIAIYKFVIKKSRGFMGNDDAAGSKNLYRFYYKKSISVGLLVLVSVE